MCKSKGGGILILSQEIKLAEPSTSSLRSTPLKGSGVTDQTEDLLIGRVRKRGALGASFAGGQAQVIMTVASLCPIHVLNIFLSKPPAAF